MRAFVSLICICYCYLGASQITALSLDSTLSNHSYLPSLYDYRLPLFSSGSYNVSYSFSDLNFNSGFSYSTEVLKETNLLWTDDKLLGGELKPMSEIFYVNGIGGEQYFGLSLVQKVTKPLTVYSKLNRITSEGDYTNTASKNLDFDVLLNLDLSRYDLDIGFRHSSFNRSLNGGIEIGQDTILEAFQIDPSFISVLTNANVGSSQNVLNAKHSFSFDSTSTLNFFIENNYLRHKRVYEENTTDSVYFNGIVLNNARIEDSLFVHILGNSIGIGNNVFKLHLNNEYVNFYQNHLGKQLISNSVLGSVHLPFNNISNSLSSEYCFSGYGTGNYWIKGAVDYSSDSSKYDAYFNVKYASNKSFYKYQYFENDIVNWNNQFNRENKVVGDISVNIKKVGAKIFGAAMFVSNLVYLDSTISVAQHSGITSVLKCGLEGKWSLGRFHLNPKVTYQQGAEIMPLPEFIGFADLYYESTVFKKAAKVRLGVEYSYFTSYCAKGFVPLLEDYYLQSTKKVGGFSFVNVYLAAQIKSARVFVKATNILAGTVSNAYYVAPYHLAVPLRIRVGVNWRFWN